MERPCNYYAHSLPDAPKENFDAEQLDDLQMRDASGVSLNTVSIWAKTDKKNPELFHPLICHLIDVAAVCECLWAHVLQDSVKARMSRALGLDDDIAAAGKWIAFWAGAHDIGKASPGFQVRAKSQELKAKLIAAGFQLAVVSDSKPHATISTCVLSELLPEFGIERALAQRIATTVGGHHGTFPRAEQVEGYDDGTGHAQWKSARRAILCELAAFVGVNRPRTPAMSGREHPFFMLLAGLTSVADWIGSNTEYFPLAGEVADIDTYSKTAKGQAQKALDHLGWAGWTAPDEPKKLEQLFDFITADTIRPLQTEVVKLAPQLKRPTLVLIEAPMGEGKTEAAMYLADYWAATLKQQGCYFALPTMATSNQMFKRVLKFLRNRYEDADRLNVMLQHGHAALSSEFEALKTGSICDDDANDGAGANVVASEWFTCRKRGFLAPFGVGTVDQALLAVLQTKHVFVRLFGLAHKTVIIDEVHAYDAYMSKILRRLLKWLRALGCSVVMLSATLSTERRKALLHAYAGRNANESPDEKYPRVSWVDDDGRIQVRHFDACGQKTLRLKWREDDLQQLATDLDDALKAGGCAAVICNTVARAQEVYQALKPFFPDNADDGLPQLDLFHARYPFEERDHREKRALKRFGKPKDNSRSGIPARQDDEEAKRPNRAVLVATQVIEQSLDLDFDLLITELAPVDLVLQRAGRLHRHQRDWRPPALGEPQVWLLKPTLDDSDVPDFGRSKSVYDEHVLLRSWLALKDRDAMYVPAGMDSLISLVYDKRECPQELPDAIAAKWRVSAQALDKRLKSQAAKAQPRLILEPDYEDDILEDFNLQLAEDNPDVHPTIQALTRDSDIPTVSAICLYGDEKSPRLRKESGEQQQLIESSGPNDAKELMRRSVNLSHRGVTPPLLNQSAPRAWKQNSLLRHCRALFFDKANRCSVGQYTLHLDDELGVRVEPKAEPTDDHEGFTNYGEEVPL